MRELAREGNAQSVWGAGLVLVRPDEFVSWHGDEVDSEKTAEGILLRAVGFLDQNQSKRVVSY